MHSNGGFKPRISLRPLRRVSRIVTVLCTTIKNLNKTATFSKKKLSLMRNVPFVFVIEGSTSCPRVHPTACHPRGSAAIVMIAVAAWHLLEREGAKLDSAV